MFRNDFFDFHTRLRQTLGTFVEGWSRRAHNTTDDSWELELRIGTLSRSSPQPPHIWRNQGKQRFQSARDNGAHFKSAVNEAYFLALFQAIVHSATLAGSVTPSTTDFIERYRDGQRRRFERVGHEMRLLSVQHKKRMHRPHDFEPDNVWRIRSANFGMRLASSVEIELPLDHTFDDMRSSTSSFSWDDTSSGNSTASEPIATAPLVKRERRTVIFDDAQTWQIDFTRINDGEEFSIEVELRWPYAREQQRAIWLDKFPHGTPAFDRFLIDVLERDLIAIVERIDGLDVGHDARVHGISLQSFD